MRVHQLSGISRRGQRAVIDAEIGVAAFDERYVRPVEIRAGLLITVVLAKVALEYPRARSRGTKLSTAALEEWRPERHMLGPGKRPVRGRKIFQSLTDLNGTVGAETNLALETQLRNREGSTSSQSARGFRDIVSSYRCFAVDRQPRGGFFIRRTAEN